MNWFKIAKNFSDRNAVNDKIIYLSELASILEKMSKRIFQNASLVKSSTSDILYSKKITSYPLLQDIIMEANEIALDSPWKFESLCKEAIAMIENKIYELKEERTKLTANEDDDGSFKVEKGWVYER